MNSRLSVGAPLVVQPAPCRIDLQERVLDEMAHRHRQPDDTGRLAPPTAQNTLRGGLGNVRSTKRHDPDDAHRAGVAVFVDVSGGRHKAHRGAGRALPRRGSPRPRARALRPARAASRRRCTAVPGHSRSRRPTTSSRSGGPWASRPTAPSRTCRSRPTASPRMHRELRTGGYDVVHVHEPVAPLTGWVAPTGLACRSSARSTRIRTSTFRTGSPTLIGARRCSIGYTCGSRSPRPRRGPAGAGSAATTGSSPTASTSTRTGPHSPPHDRPATGCGSCSSGRPSSARACRCCCAPSRRCASTSRPS